MDNHDTNDDDDVVVDGGGDSPAVCSLVGIITKKETKGFCLVLLPANSRSSFHQVKALHSLCFFFSTLLLPFSNPRILKSQMQ